MSGLERLRARWAPVSAVLIILACLLAPVAMASVWASAVISDTDRYVETVVPLIDDPAFQRALADKVTTAVVENLDVEVLASGIERLIRDQVETVLAGPRFAQRWAEVNRVAHRQVVMLLEGNQGGVVSAQEHTIAVNLAPIIAAVTERLVDRGFGPADRIAVVDTSFVLVESDVIAQAKGLYMLLDTLGVWLPVVTLLLFAGGVALARSRRRALLRGALGLVAAMVALAVVLILARTWFVGTASGDALTAEVAGSIFDTLVRFLRTSLRVVAVVGLATAFAAFLAGPARRRSGTSRALDVRA